MNCFCFPDRDTFRTFAAAEGLLTEDDELITCTHTYAIDEIGIITRGGAWDPETGTQLEPPTVLDGWHVNTKWLALEAWESFRVTPANPVRVWA